MDLMMKPKHILFALLVAVIWGFNFVTIKTALNEVPPLLLATIRFVLASFPLVFFIKKPTTSWAMIFGIGISLGVLKFSLLFCGIHIGVTPGIASLALQMNVLFTVVLSTLLLKTDLNFNQILGMLISFGGIFIIGTDIQESATFIGFIMIVTAAFSWAVSNILFKKTGPVDMFALVVWTSLIPPIPLFILSYIFEGPTVILSSLQNISWIGCLCILFITGVATLVGSTLWGKLLQSYDASIVAPFSLLIPIFGISSSWLVLGEQLTSTTAIASIVVLIGLVINQWQPKSSKINKPYGLKKVA
jgi:O-acetylserine/cysteine efflux transporter